LAFFKPGELEPGLYLLLAERAEPLSWYTSSASGAAADGEWSRFLFPTFGLFPGDFLYLPGDLDLFSGRDTAPAAAFPGDLFF